MKPSAASSDPTSSTGTASGLAALQHMPQIAVMNQAIADARGAQQEDQHEPVDQQGRARIAVEPRGEEQDGQEDDHRQADGARDGQQVGQRGIAPDAAMQAGDKEHHGGNADEQDEAAAQEGLIERQVARRAAIARAEMKSPPSPVVDHGEGEMASEAGLLDHAGAPTIASATGRLNRQATERSQFAPSARACGKWRRQQPARPARRSSVPRRPARWAARPSLPPARTAISARLAIRTAIATWSWLRPRRTDC